MKLVVALAFTAAALLAGAAHAVDVYKWKDSKGVVHYGDRPASGVSSALLNVPGTDQSEEEEEAANERLDKARDRLLESADDDVALSRTLARSKKATSANCAESWQRYDVAAACFSAHRGANGKGVTGMGTAVCQQVAQPTCAR